MNKALIAHWTYDKTNSKGEKKEIEVERLIGIYNTVEEAEAEATKWKSE